MKKLLLIIAVCAAMIACENKVSNVDVNNEVVDTLVDTTLVDTVTQISE